MWLAGTAMLILFLGYLLLVILSSKSRSGRPKDRAARRRVER